MPESYRAEHLADRTAPLQLDDQATGGERLVHLVKLIERKWNLPSMTRRDAAAIDLLEALDLDSPPAFLTPPALPIPAML